MPQRIPTKANKIVMMKVEHWCILNVCKNAAHNFYEWATISGLVSSGGGCWWGGWRPLKFNSKGGSVMRLDDVTELALESLVYQKQQNRGVCCTFARTSRRSQCAVVNETQPAIHTHTHTHGGVTWQNKMLWKSTSRDRQEQLDGGKGQPKLIN